MATPDEISSTEKLLELIRGDKGSSPDGKPTAGPATTLKKPERSRAGIVDLRKTLTVAVDFGHDSIKMVKARYSSRQGWQMEGYRKASFEAGLSRYSAEFSQTLRSLLKDFCKSPRKHPLWCLMSSGRTEMRSINIPRVSKKQISNAVYWSYKKDTPFDEGLTALDYDIIGETVEEGIPKISVMVYTTPRDEIERLSKLFAGTGFPLTGILLPSFAMQNLLRTGLLDAKEKTVGSLYIGDDWSCVDIFSSGKLISSRMIKAGINSLLEGILEGINRTQSQDSIMLDRRKGGAGSVIPPERIPTRMIQARKILASLRPESAPLQKGDLGWDWGKEEISQMTLVPLERLVKRIERSLEHHALNLEGDGVKRIFLFGETFANVRLDRYLGEQIGIACEIVDPRLLGNRFLGGISLPEALEERASLATAVGTALSQNSVTPNLLFTFKEKEKKELTSRINHAVFLAFSCVVALCIGIFFWQGFIAGDRATRLASLRKDVAAQGPTISQEALVRTADEAKGRVTVLRRYAERYLGITVIGELTRITPPHILLLETRVNLTKKTGPKETGGAGI